MGFSFSGDTSKLGRLIGRLAKTTTIDRRILQEVGKVLRSGVDDSFANSKTPGGRRWKKLKSRSGKPLVKTGALRKSIRVRSSREIASVGTNVPYAGVHNYGSKNIPARQFLPGKALPVVWRRRIEAVFRAELARVMR